MLNIFRKIDDFIIGEKEKLSHIELKKKLCDEAKHKRLCPDACGLCAWYATKEERENTK